MNRLAPLLIGLATLAIALAVGVVGAVLALHEPRVEVLAIAGYLLLSGGIALGAGIAGVMLGMRYLPRLSLKVALGYALGSLAAMVTILYTPFLMFQEERDLQLLGLMLAFFLIISLGFAAVVGWGVSRQVLDLRRAAQQVAEGRFDTRVTVTSGDELAELAEAFNRMSIELGAAFERQRAMEVGRRELVAAISHDLRTPLAALRAMLEAIQDGVVRDPATVAEYHERMRDEIERLSHLISDLFELSRLDAGQLQLEPVAVDLADLVTETVEAFEPRARQRSLDLALRAEPGRVRLDPVQMQRVLANLLDNAVLYTPSGGRIEVAACCRGGLATVEVVNSGGIAPEDVAHVFDRFYRGEKSRTRHLGGAGLGLAISKAIVEAHRGTIRVESGPEEGTRFTLSLPA